MELEGLKRCVHDVEERVPDQQMELITDGHMCVAKWLRENKGKNITHFFDIWHVAKGKVKLPMISVHHEYIIDSDCMYNKQNIFCGQARIQGGMRPPPPIFRQPKTKISIQ
jgi:hypothetical protein